jgi:hypothetical protein
MTDLTLDAFERQLAAALAAYADDAGPMPDPFLRARDIARAHPRRRFLPAVPFAVGPAWIVVALALALAALVAGLLLGGSPRPVIRAHAIIPGQLFGQWSELRDGGLLLDFNAASLLQSASGEAPDLGYIVVFDSPSSSSLEASVEIDGAPGCPPGRYRLLLRAFGSGEPGGPTPAAVEVSPGVSPYAGPVMIDSVRFSEPDDRCGSRVDALVGPSWQRWARTLTSGATVDSLAFTEPFELRISTQPVQFGSIGMLTQTKANNVLDVGHPYWNGRFLDDGPVFRDLCDPTAGSLSELPSDLAGIREWIRPAELRGLRGPTSVTIDGRTALRWQNDGACGDQIPAITADVYGDVIYAIPTGDDVIIWAFRFDTAADEALGDAVAQAIHFK